MKIPRFALICCCCCTHALLDTKKVLDTLPLANSDEFMDTIAAITSDGRSNLHGRFDYPDEPGDDHDHDDDDHDHDHDDHDHEDETWTKSQKWGYATLANTFLVLLSFLGLLVLQCRGQNSRTVVTDLFMGLAVSTMLGDAFFHIMPHMLGLHAHSHDHDHDEEEHDHAHDPVRNLYDVHEDEHDHEEEEEDMALVVGKIGVLVGSMYAMWLISSLMRLSGVGHGHSHNMDLDYDKPKAEMVEKHEEKEIDEEKGANESIEMDPPKSEVRWSTIVGILIGDCFHNFIDGIAVGVAWSASAGAGLGTTIAITMHEIPHELADFVLYKKLGLSTRGALGLNVLAAFISFGGLFMGLALGEDPSVVDWLLALVAGLFVYISLVDVMPELTISKDDENKYSRLSIQNVGLLLGYIMMILLALYEDDISNLA